MEGHDFRETSRPRRHWSMFDTRDASDSSSDCIHTIPPVSSTQRTHKPSGLKDDMDGEQDKRMQVMAPGARPFRCEFDDIRVTKAPKHIKHHTPTCAIYFPFFSYSA